MFISWLDVQAQYERYEELVQRLLEERALEAVRTRRSSRVVLPPPAVVRVGPRGVGCALAGPALAPACSL
jgi:hypothetical protein